MPNSYLSYDRERHPKSEGEANYKKGAPRRHTQCLSCVGYPALLSNITLPRMSNVLEKVKKRGCWGEAVLGLQELSILVSGGARNFDANI